MKVFISWSGPTSHRVAVSLRDWLPSVIQSITPYVSSEDIDKGERWSTDIASELHQSNYGIICITKDNISAPWINFEAGALGKSMDKSRVSPVLFKVKRSEVNGPLLQFQSTVFEKEDVFKLIKSINSTNDVDTLPEQRLNRYFEGWWPSLEKDLQKIEETEGLTESEKQDDFQQTCNVQAKLLEEILELTRNNHKILRDPSAIMPIDYIKNAIQTAPPTPHFAHAAAARDVQGYYDELIELIRSGMSEAPHTPLLSEIYSIVKRMEAPISFFARKSIR